MESGHLTAPDGYRLAYTRFRPAGTVRGTVLVAGAMGVAQRYYAPFGKWLATRGLDTFTFDYRGIGQSAPRTLRAFAATIDDWIRLDCAAMVERTAENGMPLTWLGHSLGGQILPLVPNADRVDKVVMVATGNGYWRLHDPRMKALAALLWFGIAPPALALAGYFPGRRLGVVGDLPAGVMRQWRRWCLHPRYAAGVEQADAAYAAFSTPVGSISIADDEFMSARNTDALHAQFTGTTIKHTRVAPADLGVLRIGHFGAFRPGLAEPLWERCVVPLLA